MENTEMKQPSPPVQAPRKKRLKKRLKRLIPLLVLVLIIAPIILRLLAGGPVMGPSVYLTDTAARRDLTVAVSGSGTIQPINSYQVTTLVKGEVLNAPFEEGDQVQKDALLYQIDAEDVRNNISHAQLGVEQAQLAYDQLLRGQKDTQLKANADGVIQSLPFDPGDNIAAGSVVATILDNSTMKLTVPFHAADASLFTLGQVASVAVDGTTEILSGTVDEISATNSVGPGGTLVRSVTVKVPNPGALDVTCTGTATIAGATCASSGPFSYAANKEVVARTSGELAALSVKEGDPVTDGQIIGAFQGDAISDQIETARLGVKAAQLTLQSAQDTLDNYTIKAPISGTIIEKNYKTGDNVDPSAAANPNASPYLAVIYDMTTLTFDMNISELDISKIKPGLPVEITADSLDGTVFSGVVDKVNINGTTANGKTTYPVTVKLEGGGTELLTQGLYPGMNISAKIIVEEAGQLLTIPVDYVIRGNVVLVAPPEALDANGTLMDPSKLQERTVTLGRSSDQYIEILDGIQEGEIVLQENRASSAMSMMMGG